MLNPISRAPGLSRGTPSAISCAMTRILSRGLITRHEARRQPAQPRIVDPPRAGDVAIGEVHQAELHVVGVFLVPVGAGARGGGEFSYDRLWLCLGARGG